MKKKLYKKAHNIWRNNISKLLTKGKPVMSGYYASESGLNKLKMLIGLLSR